MELKEIKQKKCETEIAIMELMDKFKKETGLYIASINISHMNLTNGDIEPIHVQCEVKGI